TSKGVKTVGHVATSTKMSEYAVSLRMGQPREGSRTVTDLASARRGGTADPTHLFAQMIRATKTSPHVSRPLSRIAVFIRKFTDRHSVGMALHLNLSPTV